MRATPVITENLLSRVNNSSSNDKSAENENDLCENKPNSGANCINYRIQILELL